MWNICHIQNTLEAINPNENIREKKNRTNTKRRTSSARRKKIVESPIELTSLQTIFNFYKALNVEQIKRDACTKEEKSAHKTFGRALHWAATKKITSKMSKKNI